MLQSHKEREFKGLECTLQAGIPQFPSTHHQHNPWAQKREKSLSTLIMTPQWANEQTRAVKHLYFSKVKFLKYVWRKETRAGKTVQDSNVLFLEWPIPVSSIPHMAEPPSIARIPEHRARSNPRCGSNSLSHSKCVLLLMRILLNLCGK